MTALVGRLVSQGAGRAGLGASRRPFGDVRPCPLPVFELPMSSYNVLPMSDYTPFSQQGDIPFHARGISTFRQKGYPLEQPGEGTRAPQGWTPSAESRRSVRRPGQIPSWRRPMQISRISAESGKAFEIRQGDITAHNSQQSHFSMIIYRFLAPSMKNGEIPVGFSLQGARG